MNYYRRYVGDYLRDTAHLSMLEHGAYTILLDHYYSTGKALPAGLEALYRLCRAMTKLEQLAVRSVIQQYFPSGDDGKLHNPRADEEITKAKATIEKQRESGVESAAKRWSTDRSTHESTQRSAIQPPTTNHQPPVVQPPSDNHQPPQEDHGSRKNGARHATVDSSPVIQTLLLKDGSSFEVRQSFVAELEPLYPAVDVTQTINEMKGWTIGNPEKRKTRRGIKAFITKWLHNEQEKLSGG